MMVHMNNLYNECIICKKYSVKYFPKKKENSRKTINNKIYYQHIDTISAHIYIHVTNILPREEKKTYIIL